MYPFGISLHRLPGQPVNMPRFETWTSVARNWRTNHAKLTLRDKLKAAAMDRICTIHDGEKKYLNCGAESSMKAALSATRMERNITSRNLKKIGSRSGDGSGPFQ